MSNFGYSNNNQQEYSGQGEAASYYASATQQQTHNGQQQYIQQQQFRQDVVVDGPDGERGFLGAVGGGIAGGLGGHALGPKTGHSKTSTIIGAIAGAVAGHKVEDGVEGWKDKRDEKKEDEKRRREDEERRREEEEECNKKRRQEEEERKRRQPQHHSDGVRYAGGFSGSCNDIRLDASGEYVLRASCKAKDGSYRASTIALNKIIANEQGSFRWVSASAARSNNNNNNNNNSCGGGGEKQYTVAQGDTLRDIGCRVGVSWEEIARHNHIAHPDLIFPGQVLNIPGGGGGHHSDNKGGHGQAPGNFGASVRNVRLEDCGKRLVGELRRGDGQWVGASLLLDEKIGNDNGCLVYKE
ncbi:CVNH domain-containing protein [Apodospora peruviana]|uniref:CVNH domain-containing protein n=1 Tax=Apodospora peruviana TaxID=516989 RepID=A0AAE0IQ60_9PEZI|nr:CVNH domain-containing protein [Apodospora peruviana]